MSIHRRSFSFRNQLFSNVVIIEIQYTHCLNRALVSPGHPGGPTSRWGATPLRGPAERRRPGWICCRSPPTGWSPAGCGRGSSRCRGAGTPGYPSGSGCLQSQRMTKGVPIKQEGTSYHPWTQEQGCIQWRHAEAEWGRTWCACAGLQTVISLSWTLDWPSPVLPGSASEGWDGLGLGLSSPLWCWEAKGWKCLAYCSASSWLPMPPLSRLMKYRRCSLNSRLLFKSRRRWRFVTAHLGKLS